MISVPVASYQDSYASHARRSFSLAKALRRLSQSFFDPICDVEILGERSPISASTRMHYFKGGIGPQVTATYSLTSRRHESCIRHAHKGDAKPRSGPSFLDVDRHACPVLEMFKVGTAEVKSQASQPSSQSANPSSHQSPVKKKITNQAAAAAWPFPDPPPPKMSQPSPRPMRAQSPRV